MKKIILVLMVSTSLLIMTGCKGNDSELICEDNQQIVDGECVDQTVDLLDFSEIYPNNNTYYELFVRSFADSDGDGVGDFNGITAKLGYLQDLGITAIWLMPINPSPTYHGYDVTDYYAVNSDYGTMEDFENLLTISEEMGIDIIMDLVINHTSSQHPWFQGWLAGDPQYDGYYRKITAGDSRLQNAGAWGQDIWHSMSGGFYCGYFGGDMPDLNWSNPVVQNEMVNVAEFWLEKGVDGFRLDAALHLEGVNEVKPPTVPIDSTLNKLEYFQYQIEKDYPNTYLVGEIYDAFSVSSLFYQAIDSTLNFEIGGEIIHAVNAGFSTDYVTKIIRYNQIIASYNPNGIDSPFLRNHDQDRIASELNGDMAKLKLSAEMLLTLPGNPVIYYGEELGMYGVKSTGPSWDETRRLPLPFGDNYTTTWFVDDFNGSLETAADQMLDSNSLFHTYKTILAVRNSSNALKYGDIFAYEDTNNVLLGYYRVFNYSDEYQEIVLVLHNVSDGEYLLYLNDEEIMYYSLGVKNFDGTMSGETTLILKISNEMMDDFYE